MSCSSDIGLPKATRYAIVSADMWIGLQNGNALFCFCASAQTKTRRFSQAVADPLKYKNIKCNGKYLIFHYTLLSHEILCSSIPLDFPLYPISLLP